jgi:hypothetical protein
MTRLRLDVHAVLVLSVAATVIMGTAAKPKVRPVRIVRRSQATRKLARNVSALSESRFEEKVCVGTMLRRGFDKAV